MSIEEPRKLLPQIPLNSLLFAFLNALCLPSAVLCCSVVVEACSVVDLLVGASVVGCVVGVVGCSVVVGAANANNNVISPWLTIFKCYFVLLFVCVWVGGSSLFSWFPFPWFPCFLPCVVIGGPVVDGAVKWSKLTTFNIKVTTNSREYCV